MENNGIGLHLFTLVSISLGGEKLQKQRNVFFGQLKTVSHPELIGECFVCLDLESVLVDVNHTRSQILVKTGPDVAT